MCLRITGRVMDRPTLTRSIGSIRFFSCLCDLPVLVGRRYVDGCEWLLDGGFLVGGILGGHCALKYARRGYLYKTHL